MTSYSPVRRRQYGPRCASPPTFVCYELPQPDPYSRSPSPTSSDHYSGDDCRDSGSETESRSNSDDEDDRSSANSSRNNPAVVDRMMADSDENQNPAAGRMDVGHPPQQTGTMQVDPKDIPCPSSGNEDEDEAAAEERRAEKREGKKKEVAEGAQADETPAAKVEEQEPKTPPKPKHKKRRSKKRREEAPEIRPILTIRSSQGFVWNQDLFVPPYIKERYIASSPPSSLPVRKGASPNGKVGGLVNNNFFSTSNAADFEVECVEIRIDEDEMDGLIPRR